MSQEGNEIAPGSACLAKDSEDNELLFIRKK